MKPWYVKRLDQFDPYASKHSGGRQPRRDAGARRLKKRRNARVARARTNNWPRGR